MELPVVNHPDYVAKINDDNSSLLKYKDNNSKVDIKIDIDLNQKVYVSK